jgi:hypothetical protein
MQASNQLRYQLLSITLPDFEKSLKNCKDDADVQAATRAAFTEVMLLVFPDDVFV